MSGLLDAREHLASSPPTGSIRGGVWYNAGPSDNATGRRPSATNDHTEGEQTMPDLSRHTRMGLVAALLAASALGACGDDKKAVTTTPTTAKTTATTKTPDQVKTNPSEIPATTPEGKKRPPTTVTKVTDPARSLTAGGLKVEIKVNKVVDPVLADVDEPQKGGRFVGIFLSTRASGSYEPSKVAAIASLKTSDGKTYFVRLISGGECEGSFFPSAFVLKSKKPRLGCIGFDVPNGSTPDQIELGVRSTTSGKFETARWALPAPK